MIIVHGEIHSSKNSTRIMINRATRRPFVGKSTAAKDDEEMLAREFNNGLNRDEWARMTVGKEYPLHVVFHFVRKTRGKWDFANLVQGVADAMVKAEYLPDDSVEFFVPVFGGYTVHKTAPGVDIWVQ